MDRQTGTRWSSRLGTAALAVALGIGAWIAGPAPAEAQFWFGFDPRYYAPFPYYYPPPPAYYPYYPSPAPAYYPPAPGSYPPPAASAPGAAQPAYGAPPPEPGYGAPPSTAGAPAASPAAATAITYTARPAFRNTAGQTCREYRAPNGALGSACQDPSGQWRVAE